MFLKHTLILLADRLTWQMFGSLILFDLNESMLEL
jgi:hypothetical protein